MSARGDQVANKFGVVLIAAGADRNLVRSQILLGRSHIFHQVLHRRFGVIGTKVRIGEQLAIFLLKTLPAGRETAVGGNQIGHHGGVMRGEEGDHVFLLRRIHVAIDVRRQTDITLPLVRIAVHFDAGKTGVQHHIGAGENARFPACLRTDAAHHDAFAGLVALIGKSGENFRWSVAIRGAENVGAHCKNGLGAGAGLFGCLEDPSAEIGDGLKQPRALVHPMIDGVALG